MATESGGGRIRTIDRVTSDQLAQGYIQNSIPAIVIDALDDWHLDEFWSLEYLTDAVGHKPIEVCFADEGFFYNQSEVTDWRKARDFHGVEMTCGEAIQTIKNAKDGQQIYIFLQSLRNSLPELLKNLSTPQWNRSATSDFYLSIGRDTRGGLHHDFADNFFAQVYGTKRFTIFDPEDSDYLYPNSPDAFMAHCSRLNANKPDLTVYPKFSLSSEIRLELHAGEMLYLPGYWWHQVDSIGMSISISNWAPERFTQLVDAANSTRSIIYHYRIDRLASFRKECLSPENLDLETAASQLLKRGRNCSAYLLAIAAFDELVVNHYPRTRPKGCSLKELSEEMKTVSEMIQGLSLLSRQTAIRSTLQSIPHLTLVASQCNDADIERSDVTDLLDAIQELRTEL